MEKFTFENQGTHTFLVYEVSEGEQLNTLVAGMTSNNQIDGILPMNVQQRNMNVLCKYNISSLTSLEDFFMGDVNRKKVVSVLANLTKTIMQAERYLLDENDFVWDMRYIFLNSTSYETFIVAKPTESVTNVKSSYVEFIKEILNQIIFDETEDGTYIVKIRNYVNRKDEFDYKKFLEILLPYLNKTDEQNVSARVNSSRNKAIKETAEAKAKETVAEKPVNVVSGTPLQQAHILELKNENEQKKPMQKEQKKESLLDRFFGKKKEEMPKATSPISFAVPGTPATPNVVEAKKVQNMLMPQVLGTSQASLNPRNEQREQIVQTAAGAGAEKSTNNEAAARIMPNDNIDSARKEDCGNTVLMEEESEVTVLMSDAENGIGSGATEYYITRKRNGQKARISKELFRIGRSGEVADFYIGDNNQIGREHAFVIKTEDGIYIKDNNSRNHTYVNEVMVQAGERVALKDGDEIRLANEVFTVNVER